MQENKLSANQIKVMECVKKYIEVYKFSPTVREICAETGIKSTSTVHLALKVLSDIGLLTYTPGTRRAIQLLQPKEAEYKSESVTIPLVGNVAAGQPILAVDNIQEFYNLPHSIVKSARDDTCFLLRVKGDSMIDIGMFENDMIIVNQSLSVSDGEIAVVRIDDSVTVKRFYREKGRVRLQPENANMQPIYAPLGSVELVGKVVGLIRNY